MQTIISKDMESIFTHIPPFWVQSSPKSNFPHEKSIFPISIFTKIVNYQFQQIFDRHKNWITALSFITTKNILWKWMNQIFEMGVKLTFRGGNLTWGNFIQKVGEMGNHHRKNFENTTQILNFWRIILKYQTIWKFLNST